MTPEQIRLVQDSFVKLLPIADTAAETFYAKLFELDPALKELFKNNMREQGHKLMTMIHTAVISLDDLEPILPMIQESGRRHAGYGVKDKDYDIVGAALLWALAQSLNGAFTADVKEAWAEVYRILAKTMQEAAT